MPSLLVSLIVAGFTAIAAAGLAPTMATAQAVVEGGAPNLAGAPRDVSRPIRGVVELFTSQGCSSCPPADALLKRYADSPDIVALSFPIDYWDYLGWKDSLATPRNTDRQRAYAKARGDGAVYTPQVVVNGVSHVNGASQRDIDTALERGQRKLVDDHVPVRFWLEQGTVVIETGLAPDKMSHPEATIWLAHVTKVATVSIQRGENGGRSVVYTNVVREIAPVGMWSGKPTQIRLARSSIMRPQSEASAILVQAGDGGPIIGAAWMGF